MKKDYFCEYGGERYGGHIVVIHTPRGLLNFFALTIMEAYTQALEFIFWRTRPGLAL